ncbi:FAS1-like dehydratase domain-containing protein [Azohydromonas australica]|uniref:FAS1-like dehydratase domain-containing protein n=1 Tax=Azohydromonas australica TaxID=364039 RepID=UPI0003F4EE33|nr:MaoC family dehydratase N-terminal domain-containing protein [Azohydromonas australica]
MTSIDLSYLRQWVGRQERADDSVRPIAARQMAAALSRGHRVPAESDDLPLLWHWLCFPAIADGSELGLDGHPARGHFLPPVPLPRRMWAAGRLVLHRAPRIGEPLRRISTIADVKAKDGCSGPLVFVIVKHEIESRGQPCITEWQDIVYRDAARPGVGPRPIQAAEEAAVCETVPVNATLLFRYSALTFNGHRIHYDRDYATGVEGYPGLVVHGPLVATLLAGLLERTANVIPVRYFEFRAVRPLFDFDTVTLYAQANDGTVSLWARNGSGHLAMSATAR